MQIHINKVEDNINYIENKDSTIFIESDDGLIMAMNNFYALCYRIWIDKELPFDVGLNITYEISSGQCAILEGYIVDKGIDEDGQYIVFLNDYNNSNKNQQSEPYFGENSINVTHSPDMFKGAHKMIEAFNNRWPSFHDVFMSIIEKTSSKIILEFSEGYLGDKIIQVVLDGIIYEEYDESLEYFADQMLTGVEYVRRENSYEFKLFNDYQSHILPEGIELSDLRDIDSSIIDEIYIVEDHKNHGIIKCKDIEFITRVDKIKKLELEEIFKKLREGQ
ncbi:MAG: hypothetical protein GX129_06480 [Clostridiales bacterium]|jgi:hypothetical protein|nr:hypothetical protein [Clostridiales bacterium]